MSDEKKGPRLGRGLSALLGDDADPGAGGAALAGSHPVPIEHLHRGQFQPRRRFDAASLEALANSIRAQGVLQPLLVRPHPARPGEYEFSPASGAGARRRRRGSPKCRCWCAIFRIARRSKSRSWKMFSARTSTPSRRRGAMSGSSPISATPRTRSRASPARAGRTSPTRCGSCICRRKCWRW